MILLHRGGRARDVPVKAADENPGWFKRFRFWLYSYDLEIGLGFLVAAISWKILHIMAIAPADAFTSYQAIMTSCALLILFVVTAIMFNSARTRESAMEMLEELRRGNAKKR